MFNRIARRYDLANKFMSLGMDQGWRRGLVAALELAPSDACSTSLTGRRTSRSSRAPRGRQCSASTSANMLAIGRTKVAAAGLDGTVELALGSATDLEHLADGGFDKISISFGIRNIPDVDGALREMRRVAAPGATLAVMEFCEPTEGVLAPIARLFIKHVVPRLGALLSGARWDEYNHLQRLRADAERVLQGRGGVLRGRGRRRGGAGVGGDDAAVRLKYEVIKSNPNGAIPKIGDLIAIRFKGSTEGRVFDDITKTASRSTTVGGGSLIKGIDEAVTLMHYGETWGSPSPATSASGPRAAPRQRASADPPNAGSLRGPVRRLPGFEGDLFLQLNQ
ncbi:2-octaprenyl-6-methoxy-1,4-benzoquinone methylase [Aureococcus anophagefferens]|nr:2-octaprenyl-6-methoxy-1,4-benzoquinone methylase [Aureococcus anophagefferens]